MDPCPQEGGRRPAPASACSSPAPLRGLFGGGPGHGSHMDCPSRACRPGWSRSGQLVSTCARAQLGASPGRGPAFRGDLGGQAGIRPPWGPGEPGRSRRPRASAAPEVVASRGLGTDRCRLPLRNGPPAGPAACHRLGLLLLHRRGRRDATYLRGCLRGPPAPRAPRVATVPAGATALPARPRGARAVTSPQRVTSPPYVKPHRSTDVITS